MNGGEARNFFKGIALDFWRKAVNPKATLAEVDFLDEVLNAAAGGKLLDIPCGNGRHSLVLAERGFAMTGLDFAAEFINEARQNAAAKKLAVDWRLADMRELAEQAEFDGAFCLGNSFGYGDCAEMENFLRRVSAALKHRARFVINTGIVAETILVNFKPKFRCKMRGLTVRIENKYIAGESRLETKFTFISKRGEETRIFSHWVFTLSEIQRMLKAAGMKTLATYRSVGKQPFQLGDHSLWLVAEKG